MMIMTSICKIYAPVFLVVVQCRQTLQSNIPTAKRGNRNNNLKNNEQNNHCHTVSQQTARVILILRKFRIDFLLFRLLTNYVAGA